MRKYQSITYRPMDGGALMSDTSADNAGLGNYVEKSNFRRYLDREILREGYDYFSPNDATIGLAPFPSSSSHPVVFLYRAERPNGESALLAGVQKEDGIHIYRYRGTDDGLYVKAGYWVSLYAVESLADWYELTETPLSSAGERLQAVTINGVTIINNGIDCPVAWKFTWDKVRPIYALREAGILNAKVMAEYNGMLTFHNVTQVTSGRVDLYQTNPYGAVTDSATQYHNRILTSQITDPLSWGAVNTGSILAGSYKLSLDGHAKSYSIGDEVVVVGAGIDGGNLIAKVTAVKVGGLETSQVKPNYRYTVVGTKPGGSVSYNGKTYTRTESFYGEYDVAQPVIVQPGFTFIHRDTALLLDTKASTSVNIAEVSLSETVGSTISFMDIADDGNAIVNAAPLQNSLVVYKENEFMILEFTGDTTDPFRYRKFPASQNALYFKNTLINLDARSHFFIGRDRFFTLSMADGAPVEVPYSRMTDSLFFNDAFKNNTNDIFTTHNALTNEIWICYKDQLGVRKALCYNYVDQSFATTDVGIASGISLERPGSALNESWFIMGFDNGVIGLYGFTDRALSLWNNAKSIFYRRNVFNTVSPSAQIKSSYTSQIKTGRGDFGDPFNEKTLKTYVLLLASTQPGAATISIAIKSFDSPYDTTGLDLMDGGSYVMASPQTNNMIPIYAIGHLFEETITVTGQGMPVEIAARIYEVSGSKTSSYTRNNAL